MDLLVHGISVYVTSYLTSFANIIWIFRLEILKFCTICINNITRNCITEDIKCGYSNMWVLEFKNYMYRYTLENTPISSIIMKMDKKRLNVVNTKSFCKTVYQVTIRQPIFFLERPGYVQNVGS